MRRYLGNGMTESVLIHDITNQEVLRPPASQSAWHKMRAGSEERNSVPRSVFLIPERRRYPVKTYNSSTGRYEYSERMLRAAISVANRQGDTEISARASRLLKEHFGGGE